MRLVEDDEAVVERAPAHEGERSDLDDPAVDKVVGALHVGHVEKRVIERADIGVDFLVDRTRQKAEVLPRLNDGPGQDDAPDFLALKRGDGHRHGEIGLACSCGAKPERDGVGADGVDVALLAGRFRPDGSPAEREENILAQRLGREFRAAEKLDRAQGVLGGHFLAPFRNLDEVGEKCRKRLHFALIACEDDGVAPHGDVRLKGGFDDPQRRVRGADDKR